jgi:hypothetical protein
MRVTRFDIAYKKYGDRPSGATCRRISLISLSTCRLTVSVEARAALSAEVEFRAHIHDAVMGFVGGSPYQDRDEREMIGFLPSSRIAGRHFA